MIGKFWEIARNIRCSLHRRKMGERIPRSVLNGRLILPNMYGQSASTLLVYRSGKGNELDLAIELLKYFDQFDSDFD